MSTIVLEEARLRTFTTRKPAAIHAQRQYQGVRALLRADVRRNGGLAACLKSTGFWAIFLYRFAHALRRRRLDFAGSVLQLFSELVLSCKISRKAVIGPGLRLLHPHGVFVGPYTRMGARITIGPAAFIGANRRSGQADDYPVLGDRVHVGPGAKVLGSLHVGDDVMIGPNAVVMHSVPERSRVIVPSPIVSRRTRIR
jgi:serine O-acetyltransferase